MLVVGMFFASVASLAPGALGAPTSDDVPATSDDVPATIVLDFEGGEVHYTAGVVSDPDARTTPFSECAGHWPPYGDPTREALLFDEVRQLFADFHVVVTDEAPAEGPYLRAIVGPFSGCGGGVGYAERGCDRPLGHGIVFAKFGAQSDRDVERQAVTIAHELGHGFGLAHADNPDDVMHPTVGDGEKTFLDTCSPAHFGGAGDSCAVIGACPRGQNSHFGLMTLLGPSPEPELDASMSSDAPSCACRPVNPLHTPPLAALIAIAFRRRSQARPPAGRGGPSPPHRTLEVGA